MNLLAKLGLVISALFGFLCMDMVLAAEETKEKTDISTMDFMLSFMRQNVKLEHTVGELKAENEELKSTVEELKLEKDDMKSTMNILTAELSKLKVITQGLVKPTIVFNVRLSTEVSLMIGQKVLYNVILSNEGKVYNPRSGTFRAPVEGTYMFAVKSCSGVGYWDNLVIVNDGVTIGMALSGDDAYSNCGSAFSAVHLDAGSEVWVKKIRGNSGATQLSVYWCSFTGVLVA